MKIEFLDDFYNQIVTTLNTKFVLLTHYSAWSVPFDDRRPHSTFIIPDKILKHPLLIKWYGINMSVISDKTEAFPLGVRKLLLETY